MIFSTVADMTKGSREDLGYVFIYSLGSDYTAFSDTPLRETWPYAQYHRRYIQPTFMPELTAKERTRKFTSELNKRFYLGRSRHAEDVPRGQRLRRRR
jgi:hypothetical protein